MAVEVTRLVWQLVEAAAYKANKICHLVSVKKDSAIACVFYEQRRIKNALLKKLVLSNVKYLPTKSFKTTLNAEIQLVKHST